MQRIRVGLTGLAVVLLIVFVVTVVFDRVRNGSVNQSAATDTSDEPLAELGVAPGASDTESGNAQATKPPK